MESPVHSFLTGFLTGFVTGVVALVVYACCVVSGMPDEAPPVP